MKKEKSAKNIVSNKLRLLILGIVFDLIGLVSFIIPGIGEFIDVIWAPISAYLVMRMYKGVAGKVGGLIAFIEEGFPTIDFIPTFTLMWIYTYVIKRKKN